MHVGLEEDFLRIPFCGRSETKTQPSFVFWTAFVCFRAANFGLSSDCLPFVAYSLLSVPLVYLLGALTAVCKNRAVDVWR